MAVPDPLDASLGALHAPPAEIRGLPREMYLSEAVLERERERLFARTWTCLGHASLAPEPGDLAPVEFLGLPLVIVRAKGGRLRVFHNVCSHRGQLLVWQAGRSAGGIRCPYHAWTYGLDGRLRGTPHVGGPGVHQVEGLDRARHGLKEVPSVEWLGLVFVDLSGKVTSFAEHVDPLRERWRPFVGDAGIEQFAPAATHAGAGLVLAANWKLAVENYCESYHLPWVHPGLNRYSRLEDHYPIEHAGYAGQGTLVYDPTYLAGEVLPQLPEWPAERRRTAEYVALFPNVLLGLHADHLFTMVLSPQGPARVEERFELWYVGDGAVDLRFETARANTLAAWTAVFTEDVGVVEGMQRGRHSSAFDGGIFSPVMESTSRRFHRWVAERLRQANGPG